MLQLYNVVVDSEQTGKQLLQKGELRRRCTIIPLNKISARAIDPSVVRKAENLVSHSSPHPRPHPALPYFEKADTL